MNAIDVELLTVGQLEGDIGSAKLVQGPPGEAATVEIGTVTKGDEASVVNSGDGTHAVLDFVLPKGDQGAQGEKGVTGDMGPRGATFTPSVDVDTGLLSWTNDAALPNPEPVDIRGPKGDAGEKGDTGAQGPQGEPGEKGDTGATGPQGPKGDTGAQGETGPKGDTGERGPQGFTFIPSVDEDGNLSWTNDGALANPDTVNIMGPQGPQGPQGAKGDTGAQGAQGEQGPKGDTGPQGPKGDTGNGFKIMGYYASVSELQQAVPSPAAGDAYGVGVSEPYDIYIWSGTSWVDNGPIQGPAGPQGEQGIQGEKGEKGDAGAAGPAGADGATFTPSVDASGNLSWTNDSGLENPQTVNIRGPQGPQGEQGPQGIPGDTGPQGEQGPQGIPGETGPQGPAGADGAPGEAGPAGADGKSAYQSAAESGYTGTEAEFGAALATLKDAPFLPTSGGSVTGPLYVYSSGTAVTPNFAVMSNEIKLNAKTVLYSTYAPTEEQSVANKKYVDDLVGDIGTLLDTINGEVV